MSESRVRVQEAGIAVERREAHDRLVFDATHDALTGLLSRATAFARLDALLARDAATRGVVSVLFVDLDRLKAINDSLGHEIGDQVIAQSARRLRDCAGADGLVARLGGEEFLIVCAGDALDMARSALTALRAPLLGLPDGQELTVTGSIGIATIAGARSDARQATRGADAAMYVAKGRGGDQYAICDHADAATPTRRLVIETALRHAVERGELTVVYQPLQRFADGHVIALEALARWRHPTLGHVGPDEFIPIAEQIGLIGEIGAWVLQTACADLAALEAGYGHPLQLGINVSAQQLRDPAMAASVAGALRTHGLSADRLYIEITETALLASDDTTIQTVRALDAMGAHIALDDFGTGYSSLAVLKRHPIKAIKIDRSFVDGLTRNHDDLAIVTALLGMARSLGLGTVAEGVETIAQYDLLRELGCDFAQGYLTGRPAAVPSTVCGLTQAVNVTTGRG
jgi:diguanylate cyclase (GGDEF)-like protein